MTRTSKLDALRSAESREDLAKLLGVKVVFLTNVLYRIGTENQYTPFTVPKKGNGVRLISAPTERLKDLQRRISNLLSDCRNELFISKKIINNYSFGFEKNKSIILNAYRHRNKRIILNIDLSNFFGSFNFGRVRGYFMSNKDFLLNPTVATTIAKAACYRGVLPQGSPCSPVISNLICSIMDMRLAKLAKQYGCSYSRYADDITFSTNKPSFPTELALLQPEGVILGKYLVNEIKRAGFEINDAKTRLAYKPSRLEVTGLTVNKIVNVERRYSDKTRALAHTLYTTGEYKLPDENGDEVAGSLAKLEGMFGFIDQLDKFNNIQKKKSKQPEKYALAPATLHSFKSKLNAREKAYGKFIYYKFFHGNTCPTIVTEGKTDRIYLKAALRALSNNYPELYRERKDKKGKEIDLNILKITDKLNYFLNISGGTADLKKFVERYREHYSSYYGSIAKQPVIMVLDNDTGPNELLNFLKNKVKQCPDDVGAIRRMRYLHIFHNLYLVLTPLTEGGNETSMEDFFPAEVLSIELDGKIFNKNNDGDSKTEYGKHVFSVKIVKDKKRVIDFNRFSYIFDIVREIKIDYQKILIKNKP
ncbi:retron Ec67 family RNA-directed DNA polymerase/endonuclease [Enterobacter roggenkampii]|uniref:retron Ec67 family RNA-directed DNA polymerase/endonuclease n=2 Tax=Enterobacter roggenkampii TaxID=1812935 RepID=UPI001F4431DD|nr:retron Ec67 family RNA-directed DNA polymerase/endonuclease [Enterobacter roggenkampii]MCK6980322.1 retron Ec67 family RNA-directed DNA polymerase/endonuclease [Enterobacter roggenkampii]